MTKTPDIDLDALIKDERTIKLGGKLFKLNRIGIHQQLRFYSLHSSLRKSNNQEAVMEKMKEIIKLLDELVPGLSKSGVNVPPEMMLKLVELSASKTSDLRKLASEKKSVAKPPKTAAA